MSLTEKDINEYLKLKERKETQNKYLYSHINNKIQNAKETNRKNKKYKTF